MQTIQRLPNGTIDHDHYRRAAAAQRAACRVRVARAFVRGACRMRACAVIALAVTAAAGAVGYAAG